MDEHRRSSVVPLGGTLTTLATGTAVAAALGVLYAIAVFYIPLVYVNVLLTLALGASVGAVVAWSSKRTRIRSKAAILASSLLAGLVALYLAWSGTLLVLTGWESGLVLHPIKLGQFVTWLYHHGSWAMTEGEKVKGVRLALVWLGEAGIVLVMAVSVARGAVRNNTFCEVCQNWCKPETCLLRVEVEPEEDQDLLERLSTGDFVALDEMPVATDDAACSVQVDLMGCPICGQTNYVSMRIIRQGYGSNGEFQVISEPLLTNRAISAADLELLRDIVASAKEQEADG